MKLISITSIIFISLLIIHIVCGSICMVCSITAIATQKGSRTHKRFGTYFFYGMTGIFITAIPLAIMKSNTFLFVIALFSYYLTYSGWRYARRHNDIILKSDWFSCFIMLLTSLIMVILGLYQFKLDSVQSIVLIVFGIVSGFFSFNDARLYYKGNMANTTRIARHLGAMLGGTIAVFTAFLVTNVKIGPPIILWLGPTFIITPIIIYWTRKIEQK